jgi:signal transduction histidine kinase
MPGLSPATPEPEEDPRIRRLILEEYAQADRLRASLLAGLFFLSAAVFSALWVFTALGALSPAASVPPRLLLGAAAGTILGALELLLRHQAVGIWRRRVRVLLWYASTVVEVGIITTGWIAFAAVLPDGNALFPGAVGFAALTVLSALRLDWRITVFTGLLSAAGSAAIYLSLDPGPLPLGSPPGLFGPVSSLLTIGILSGLVAEQARRRTFHAIGAVVAREELEREVMRAAETERQRVGRDLHDGLGGRFSALALIAEGLARRVEGGQAAGANELRELVALAGEGADETRRLARGLDPAPLATGIPQALRGLAERTESAGTRCSFVFEGEAVPEDREATLHLYRIAEEAVTNAIRHGGPSHLDIRLAVRAGTIALDVLLAALCIRYGLTILTTDSDFKRIDEMTPLSVWGGV